MRGSLLSCFGARSKRKACQQAPTPRPTPLGLAPDPPTLQNPEPEPPPSSPEKGESSTKELRHHRETRHQTERRHPVRHSTPLHEEKRALLEKRDLLQKPRQQQQERQQLQQQLQQQQEQPSLQQQQQQLKKQQHQQQLQLKRQQLKQQQQQRLRQRFVLPGESEPLLALDRRSHLKLPVQYQQAFPALGRPLKGILKKAPGCLPYRNGYVPLHFLQETERKREAFMELLAQRYPEYADRISGSFSDSECPDKTPRGRDQARRRTTVVTYDPTYPRSLAGDDVGTMSDVEVPSFQRGAFARQSLPIVRSHSSSFERPLGLVFLVYGNETKRSLLPNEITTLDTVRALFVRAFPEKLSMELLESPKIKIYVMEPASKVFFQLEDLRDIKDRGVLKIHECPESDKPQVVKDVLPCRGRSVSHPVNPGPRPRPPSRAGEPMPFRDDMAKSHSLPAKPPHVYQELMEEMGQQGWATEPRPRSRSQTPELSERPKTLPVQPRRPFSPERQTTPERGGHLGPIPEDYQLINGNGELLRSGLAPHAACVGHAYSHARTLSPPPMGQVVGPLYENVYRDPHGYPPSVHMVRSVRAAPMATNPQRATGVDMRDGRRSHSNNRHSLAFAPMTGVAPGPEGFYARPQSYRPTPERELQQSVDPKTQDRIDKMEMQLASLTAWVHNSVGGKAGADHPSHTPASSTVSESTSDVFPASSASKPNMDKGSPTFAGMSDIPSTASPQSSHLTPEVRHRMRSLQLSAQELRRELRELRRLQEVNTQAMHESLGDAIMKIKRMLEGGPVTDFLPLQRERIEVNRLFRAYRCDKERVEKELGDLEASVEEIRSDVITHQCRVNMADVDGMAVILSNITKTYAELKSRFPQLQQRMKLVMEREVEVVVSEEKFLKEEPENIESALKRCKKLTGTLYTLKRLASVQEHRPIKVPDIAKGNSAPGEEEKKAILDSIRAMVPNHSQRVSSLEAADLARERKKKILTQHEALMFCKSLELTSKKLKSAESSHEPSPESSKSPTPVPEPAFALHRTQAEQTSTAVPSQSSVASTITSATSSPRVGAGSAVTSSTGPTKAAAPSSVMTSSGPAALEVGPVVSLPRMAASSPPDVVAPKKEGGDKKPDLLSQKNAARAAFFSSLASPPVSPASSTTMDYTVRLSPVRVTSTSGEATSPTYTVSSPSVLKSPEIAPKPAPPKMDLKAAFLSSPSTAAKGVKKPELSPTQSRFGSSSSSIPRPSGKLPSPSSLPSSGSGSHPAEAETKVKKVPPPPPPRKSSRLPSSSGQGLFPSSVNGSATGQTASLGVKSDAKAKGSSPLSPTSSKPVTPRKPTSQFERDIAAGIYANMNRPDLQSQKVAPEVVINQMDSQKRGSPAVAESREEREGSSDSTGSSTSLDSQKGVVLRRPPGSAAPVASASANCVQRQSSSSSAHSTSSDTGDSTSGSRNSFGKKPKPDPPERRSSLQASASSTTGSSFKPDSKPTSAGGSSAPPGMNGVKDKSSTLPYGESEVN